MLHLVYVFDATGNPLFREVFSRGSIPKADFGLVSGLLSALTTASEHIFGGKLENLIIADMRISFMSHSSGDFYTVVGSNRSSNEKKIREFQSAITSKVTGYYQTHAKPLKTGFGREIQVIARKIFNGGL